MQEYLLGTGTWHGNKTRYPTKGHTRIKQVRVCPKVRPKAPPRTEIQRTFAKSCRRQASPRWGAYLSWCRRLLAVILPTAPQSTNQWQNLSCRNAYTNTRAQRYLIEFREDTILYYVGCAKLKQGYPLIRPICATNSSARHVRSTYNFIPDQNTQEDNGVQTFSEPVEQLSKGRRAKACNARDTRHDVQRSVGDHP